MPFSGSGGGTWGTVTGTLTDQADLVAALAAISAAGVADGDKGDVTVSAAGTVWSLDALGTLVVGPASATDNAVVRFDATTGKLVQNSVVTIADTTGNVAGVGNLTASSLTVNGAADAIQAAVRGHSTQTANVFEVQTNANALLFGVKPAGGTNIPTGTTYDINGAAHTHAYATLQNVSATDKVLGRSTAGAGVIEEIACTASGRAMIATASADAQTALLTAVVGDSGAGGTKGLVPAPGAGDAAAGKFLKASGAWDVPSGSGSGDVVGPSSATDNAIARFDTTTGKLVQNSTATISDAGVLGAGTLSSSLLQVNSGANSVTGYVRAFTGQTANLFETRDAASATPLFQISPAGSVNIPTGETYKINGAAHVHTMSSLSDVDTVTPTNKHVVVGNAGGTAFESRQLASTDLSDTSVATGANDDFLQMKAGVWSNRTIAQVKTDLAVSNVTNHAQTQAAVVPNTAPAAGALLVGNAGGTAYASVAASGDVTVASTGAMTVAAASTTVAGKIECAIDSEVTTGTSATLAVTPDALAGSAIFGVKSIVVQLNGTTALTTSEKAYFRIPPSMTGMNLVSVRGACGTGAAGSSLSGTPTFTVKNVTDANQMLSTSLTIDASEYTSATAVTAVVIDATKDDVVTDDLIEVAVTTAGTGVTYATVTLGFQLP